MTQHEFQRADASLRSWQRPLLLTHERPDGDAIGSLVAVHCVLAALGRNALALLYEPCPPRYEFLWGDRGPADSSVSPVDRVHAFRPDGVLILDTCSRQQLQPMLPWLDAVPLPRIVVDHHVTRDLSADLALIDEHACAACLIVHEWAQAAGWPLDPSAREALFVGIATDCGWFRYPNTDARALQAAGSLVREGVSPSAGYERIYRRERPERLRLLGLALESLELHGAGRIAFMRLTADAFRRSGAALTDTEDIVNEPMSIRGVVVSILLVQTGPDGVKVSLRSQPPADGRPDIDVAKIALALGGGGHTRAAGARVCGSIETVQASLLSMLTAWRQ